MGRPKKAVTGKEKEKVKTSKKKIALTDVLEGKFCIAREHLDHHIETWTDGEVFKRLEEVQPKSFDSKQDAQDYIESFKDVTAEFSDDALTPVFVVPLKRFLVHSYSIEILENESGVLHPEISIEVTVKGKGTSWKDAVAAAREPFAAKVKESIEALDIFLNERLEAEELLETKADEARDVLKKIDSSLNQFQVV